LSLSLSLSCSLCIWPIHMAVRIASIWPIGPISTGISSYSQKRCASQMTAIARICSHMTISIAMRFAIIYVI
jgi:hypothetical protein